MTDLINRLRGIYTCKVDDGAGLLNGKDTFTRTFPASALPPIHAEAANEIERLQALNAELLASLDAVLSMQIDGGLHQVVDIASPEVDTAAALVANHTNAQPKGPTP